MRSSLILGGTRGFGLALARESAVRGIRPVVTGRSANDARVASALPDGAASIALDLRDRKSIDQAMKLIAPEEIDYFFWNAALWPGRMPFGKLSPEDIDAVFAVNVTGPLKMLREFHNAKVSIGQPYRLIATSSASAWLIRNGETAYCASKDAQAVFCLNFADELARELPGSRTSIFYPGGMKTDIFKDTGENTAGFMEPAAVAKVVWDEISNQDDVCRETHILRDKIKNDGSFIVEYGPKPRGLR